MVCTAGDGMTLPPRSRPCAGASTDAGSAGSFGDGAVQIVNKACIVCGRSLGRLGQHPRHERVDREADAGLERPDAPGGATDEVRLDELADALGS